MPGSCPCGDNDCWLFFHGYSYCWGCDEHHRKPVAVGPEARCPVDVMAELYDRADREDIGVIPVEWFPLKPPVEVGR